jgi:signal transduction histidine kinase
MRGGQELSDRTPPHARGLPLLLTTVIILSCALFAAAALPSGGAGRPTEPTVWDAYKWPVVGAAALCLVETVLITGLLVERRNRRRAEDGLRASREELRLLTGRLLEAQEAERRRIARELHDDVNQALALVAVEMDLLGGALEGLAPRTAARVRELSARVKEVSSSVHDLSHQLHPSKLEQLGLVAAVRGVCQELRYRHDLDLTFSHADVPGAVPAATALCVYRIAQEALRNVVKHSGAARAAVELCGTPGGLRLRVSDEGVGFDPGSARGAGGLGLVSMRERLYLVGGGITVTTRPGGGTRIEVLVPTPDPARSVEAAQAVAVDGRALAFPGI